MTLSATTSINAGQPQNNLDVENTGFLRFETDGSNSATITGGTFALNLGANSTLEMALGGVYNNGGSWTLMTGITNFNGSFGSIINPNDLSQQFSIDYGQTTAGALIITTVPEPSSATLLGLGGLALILRRRR